MQMAEAIRLLGLEVGDEPSCLRQKYHERMRKVHPDVAGHERGTVLSQLLNEAYALLKETWPGDLLPPARGRLPVPENARALIERTVWMLDAPFGEEILLEIARGKYYWAEEQESFPLFLKSVREAMLSLGSQVRLSDKESLSLFHSLAQCFVDPVASLSGMAQMGKVKQVDHSGKMKDKGSSLSASYEVPAYLPLGEEYSLPCPVIVKDSRILLAGENGSGIQLSFGEDSLYYVVTPLLLQGVLAGEIRNREGKGPRRGYENVALYLTPTGRRWEDPTEGINKQIQSLLGGGQERG